MKRVRGKPNICSSCGIYIAEKYGHHWLCQPCSYNKHKIWIEANREHVNSWRRKYSKTAKCKKTVNIIYQKRYQIMIDAKNVPCYDCGKVFPTVCMDFDHVRGIKKFTIGNSKTRSAKSILEEIAKCDVVCSNCHRIRHNK